MSLSLVAVWKGRGTTEWVTRGEAVVTKEVEVTSRGRYSEGIVEEEEELSTRAVTQGAGLGFRLLAGLNSILEDGPIPVLVAGLDSKS